MTPQQILQAVFTLSSVMTACYVVFALVLGPGEPAPLPAPPPAPKPVLHVTNPVHLGPLENYAEAVERPLFSPTRRRLKNRIVQKRHTGAISDHDLVLTGVLINGKKKLALLKARNSKKEERLAEGDAIEGWRIDEILQDRVMLSAGGKTAVVPIWDAKKAAVRRKAAGKKTANRRAKKRGRKRSADRTVPRTGSTPKASRQR